MTKETIRVSFDVPIEDHIYMRMECMKARTSFSQYMRESFHQAVQELKKKELHENIKKGIQQAKEGNLRTISQADLTQWEKMVDES